MLFNEFYLRIDTLSADITTACTEENYEHANKLLAQRLTLLKTLAAKLLVVTEESLEKQKYYRYLTALKKADDQQVTKLLAIRTIEDKRKSEKKQKNKAINMYKKFT